jgi:hypothetical protein
MDAASGVHKLQMLVFTPGFGARLAARSQTNHRSTAQSACNLQFEVGLLILAWRRLHAIITA